MEINILDLFDWKALLLCATITTFIVSAINVTQSKLSSNWLVFIVSSIVTALSTTIEPQASFSDWQKLLLQVLTTMAFAILFYNYLGKLFVDKIFAWVKKQMENKLGKDEPVG